MFVDVDSNIPEKIRISGKLTLQIDKSTDISEHAQLLANVRFVNENVIKENFFPCERLSQNATGEEIFVLLSIILNEGDLNGRAA